MQLGNYHCSVKSISRRQGRSATAAAAYRAGEEIADERTGEVHDYTRKQGVIHSEIIVPEDVNIDRETLWNQAEAAEKRKDAKVAREWELALPHELNRKEQIALAKEFAGKLVERYGVAVDVCIHEPHLEGDQRNTHAHILTSTRQITPEGFTNKTRILDSPKTSGAELEVMREVWADCCNRAYQREGLNIRTDHRTLKAQGIDREATKHLGPSATEIERRGSASELGDYNREIQAKRAELEKLQKHLVDIQHLIQQVEHQTEESQAPQLEQKKSQREYNEQTIKRAINYIQTETDINKVKQLYYLVQSDAIKKDVSVEIKKQFEYHQAEQKIISNQNNFDSAVYNQKRTAAEIDNFNMFDKAKYKLGKHEICQREKVAADSKEKAYNELIKSQREFDEVKSNLLSPTSEVYKDVYAHNKNVGSASIAFKELTAHYTERMKQEMQKEQTKREVKSDKQRGEYER